MAVAYENAEYESGGPWPVQLVLEDGSVRITYDTPITYNNQEISGFYVCEDNPDNCDALSVLYSWEEIGELTDTHNHMINSSFFATSEKDNVVLVDDLTVMINLSNYMTAPTLSLAYIWRETPVLEYLGLPIYAAQGHRLPSPPWKKLIF